MDSKSVDRNSKTDSSEHKTGYLNEQRFPKLEWAALEDGAFPITTGIQEEVT